MYVIGTAGHVDHGKSTLISSLTGINPDRLKEEQDRQMTIDLGFAWHTLPSGKEIGIVDVPGHRDFIDNMLAGVGGIDAVLFVVAADEGVMPQSREHLNILNLLGIEKGLIVLTKTDQINDPDWYALVEMDIRELTVNTFLENASIIRVSALEGSGLGDLSFALDELLDNIEPKPVRSFPRLPIDRVFSLKGFGTIVTGTLIDGTLTTGAQVEILPSGVETRIRGIQTHKKKQEVANPGNRTAVNLTGVEVSDISRGDVLCLPGTLTATGLIDIKIKLLKDCSSPLKHDDEVKVFISTAQSVARVRIIAESTVESGASGFAQLVLKNKIVCRDGDRFILRRPSPQETIGGGVVIDAHPSSRHKRFKKTVIDRFEVSTSDSPEDQIMMIISDEGVISYEALARKMEIPEGELRLMVDKLFELNSVSLLTETEKDKRTWLITTVDWQKLINKIGSLVDEYHKEFPLRKGVERNAILRSLDLEKRVALAVIDTLAEQQQIIRDGLLISNPSHKIKLSLKEEELEGELIDAFVKSGNQPPSVEKAIEMVGEELYKYLLSEEQLVELSSNIVFRKKELNEIINKTKSLLSSREKITVADFRDSINTTRKYAVALLEYMDDRKITKRVDDFRVLNIS